MLTLAELKDWRKNIAIEETVFCDVLDTAITLAEELEGQKEKQRDQTDCLAEVARLKDESKSLAEKARLWDITKKVLWVIPDDPSQNSYFVRSPVSVFGRYPTLAEFVTQQAEKK